MTTITKRYIASVFVIKEFVQPVRTDEFQPLKKYNFKTFTNKAFACVKKVAKNALIPYPNPFAQGYFGYNQVFPDPVFGDVNFPSLNVVRAKHILEARDALVRAARVLVSLEKAEYLLASFGRPTWVDDITDASALAKLPERNLWYEEIDRACDFLAGKRGVSFSADMQLALHGPRCLEWGQGFININGSSDINRQFSFVVTITNTSSMEIRNIDFATEPAFSTSKPDGPFYLTNYPFKFVFQTFLNSVEIFTPERKEFFFKPEIAGNPGSTNYSWSSTQEFTINVPDTPDRPAHTETVPGIPIPPGGGAVFTFRTGIAEKVAAFPDNRPDLNRCRVQIGNGLFPVRAEAFIVGNIDSQLPDAEFNFSQTIAGEEFNIRKVCQLGASPLEIVSISRLSGAFSLRRCTPDSMVFNVGITNFSDGAVEFNVLRLVFFWSVSDNIDPNKFGAYDLNTDLVGNFTVPRTEQGQPPTLIPILVNFNIKDAIPDGVIEGEELRCIAQLFVGDASSPQSVHIEGPHELKVVGQAGAQIEVFKPFSIGVLPNEQCAEPVTPPPPPPPVPPGTTPPVPPVTPPPGTGGGNIGLLILVNGTKIVAVPQGGSFLLEMFVSNTSDGHSGGTIVTTILPASNGPSTSPTMPLPPISVAASASGITKVFSSNVTISNTHPIGVSTIGGTLSFTLANGTTGTVVDFASWNVLAGSPGQSALKIITSASDTPTVFGPSFVLPTQPHTAKLTYTLKNTSSSEEILLQDPFQPKLLNSAGNDISGELQVNVIPPDLTAAQIEIPPGGTKTITVLISTTPNTTSTGTITIQGIAVGILTPSGLGVLAPEVDTPGTFQLVGKVQKIELRILHAQVMLDNFDNDQGFIFRSPAPNAAKTSGTDPRQVSIKMSVSVTNNTLDAYFRVDNLFVRRVNNDPPPTESPQAPSSSGAPVQSPVVAKMLSMPIGFDNAVGEYTSFTIDDFNESTLNQSIPYNSQLPAMNVNIFTTSSGIDITNQPWSEYLKQSTPLSTISPDGNMEIGPYVPPGGSVTLDFHYRIQTRVFPTPTGINAVIGLLTNKIRAQISGTFVSNSPQSPLNRLPGDQINVIPFVDDPALYDEIASDGTAKNYVLKPGAYKVSLVGRPFLFFSDVGGGILRPRQGKFGGNVQLVGSKTAFDGTQAGGNTTDLLPTDPNNYFTTESAAESSFSSAAKTISIGGNTLSGNLQIKSSFIDPFSNPRATGKRSTAIKIERLGSFDAYDSNAPLGRFGVPGGAPILSLDVKSISPGSVTAVATPPNTPPATFISIEVTLTNRSKTNPLSVRVGADIITGFLFTNLIAQGFTNASVGTTGTVLVPVPINSTVTRFFSISIQNTYNAAFPNNFKTGIGRAIPVFVTMTGVGAFNVNTDVIIGPGKNISVSKI